MVAQILRIGRLDENGARLVHLEGDVAERGDALAVGHARRLEVELPAIHHDGVGFAGVDIQVVTDHLFLDGAGEELGVRQVPGLVSGKEIQREVLRLLHERGPPFGRTHLLVGDFTVCQEIEETTRGIVARIVPQDRTGRLALGKVVGEIGDRAGIILRQVVEPVVRSGDTHVSRRDVLGVGTRENGLTGHIQDQVVLEGEGPRGDLESEDTRVVRVVHEIQVLQGVVLEYQGADGAGVEADERTHALPDRVVHEGEALQRGGLTDVEDISADSTVRVDVVDVTAVIRDMAQHHVVAPFIHEALGIVRDHAVLIGDVADVLVLHRTTVLVLDGETETGRAGGGRTAVELDALEIEVGARSPGVGDVELALDHRFGAVGGFLTEQGKAVGDIQRLDIVRGAFHLEEDLGTRGLDRVQERFRGIDLGRSVDVRRGPGVHLTAAGREVVQREDVLRGSIQTVDGRRAGTDLRSGERVGSGGISPGQAIFDPVDLLEVRHFRGPGQGDGAHGTSGDFQEKVVLHGESLEGLIQEGDLGIPLSGGRSLDGEPVGLVGLQFLLVRDLGRKDRLAQVHLGTRGIRIDDEIVRLRILGHIPGEGHHVTLGGAHTSVQAHRGEAAGKVQFGNLVELLRLAGGCRNQGREGEDGIFDLVHSCQGIRCCHSHSRS